MSDAQRVQTFALLRVLRLLLADRTGLRVSANFKLYHDTDRLRRFIRLDVFVIPVGPEGDIFLAQGDRPPELIIEMTYTNLRLAATAARFRLYKELRIKEVFVFPLDYNPPCSGLTGFRLQGGSYRPITETTTGGQPSRVLGYHLQRRGETLCFLDPKTGEQVATTGSE